MTGRQHTLPGDLAGSQRPDRGYVADLSDVAAGARADETSSPASAAADLSNVIPFARARRHAESSAPALALAPAERPAPAVPDTGAQVRLAFVAGSLAIHCALLAAFWQQPRPLASVGIEAITVEIVPGAHTEAGLAPTPGEAQGESPAVAEELKPDEQVAERSEPTTAAPQEVPVAVRETAPEEIKDARPVETAKPDEKLSLAMVETPQAEVPTALPQETPPETITAVVTPPVEQPKEEKPVAEQPQPKQPVQKKERAPERKRIAARTAKESKNDTRTASAAPSTAASGIGRGRSDNDTNYRGIVFTHLARHKQFPAAARSSGTQGAGTVSFALDGGGRVTSVNVVRGTGVAALDAELQAMVRRASPFPAPPGGRSQRFTAPITFQIR